MALTQLSVRHFRNIESADLTPATHINCLIGDNGSGKTSLLEAIYTLGHGRAFRTQHSDKVIQYEQNEFTLYGKWQQPHQNFSLGLSKNRLGESRVRINHSDNHKISELAQIMPIQLITPEGFTLLTGGPKFRRAFIDWGCFHQETLFFSIWSQLKQLLKQRNAALRQAVHYDQLKIWDLALITLSEQISQWRAHYVETLQQDIIKTCQLFLPEYPLTFSFYQGWDRELSYSDLLERQFERDKQLTYTTLGPHKADLKIRILGKDVEHALSRGQLKLLMCALRLAQGEHFSRTSDKHCLYLIDDFTSELDSRRRQLLATQLKATGAQIFVSAITSSQVTDMFADNNKMFWVKHGKISDYSSP